MTQAAPTPEAIPADVVLEKNLLARRESDGIAVEMYWDPETDISDIYIEARDWDEIDEAWKTRERLELHTTNRAAAQHAYFHPFSSKAVVVEVV